MRLAIGCPMITNITSPTTNVDSSGMTTTGITPRTPFGTFQRLIHSARKPAMKPVTRPPRKPAPTATEIAPPTKPGTRPGRSAMRVGDEAGQDRDQEPERDGAGLEQQRRPVHAAGRR